MNYIDEEDNNSIDHESECQSLDSQSHSDKNQPFTYDLDGNPGADVKVSSMFSPTHKKKDSKKGGSTKRDDEEYLEHLGISNKAKSFAL